MTNQIKAVWFDFMGTVLDWHSSIVDALPSELSYEEKSKSALDWRQAYFDHNSKRLAEGEPVLDFDETQRRVLDAFLDLQPDLKQHFPAHIKAQLVSAWHNQKAWPDVHAAMKALKQDPSVEVFVHANGSTRLQLDLVKSAGLEFDMLFSSELLGVYKPSPESFLKAMKILKLKPEECVMVAAHAHDVEGAKAVGMKTIYICRWTDDILEDQEALMSQFDAYLRDMTELSATIYKL